MTATVQLNLFDSLPQDVVKRLSDSAEALASTIQGHDSGVQLNVESLLPALYTIFVEHCATGDPSEQLARNAALFASSLRTFADQIKRNGFFKQVSPNENIVRRAFRTFCVSGQSFLDECREDASATPTPTKSYIRQLDGMPADFDLPPVSGVTIVNSANMPKFSSSAELMGALRPAVFAFRSAASVAMRNVEAQAHGERMHEYSSKLMERGGMTADEAVRVYFNKGTLVSYRIMMGAFERWLLVDLARVIEEVISIGSEAIQRNRPMDIIRAAKLLIENLEAGQKAVLHLGQSEALYSKLLDHCKKQGIVEAGDERWTSLKGQLEGFCHDYTNLLAELLLIAQKLRNDPTMRGGAARAVIENDLPSLRMTDPSSQLNLVNRLLRNKADRKDVEIEIAASASVNIPVANRLSIFRIVHELGLNGVKHGGVNVRLRAEMDGNKLRMVTSDNGPGFADLEKALGGGWREHPDIEGQGKGLVGIVRLANLRGWDFNISREGGWTCSVLVADTSGWDEMNRASAEAEGSVPIDDALMLDGSDIESAVSEFLLPPISAATAR